jgi:methylmalonyl-CoA/ethylmalonyl-CoA epimerase
MGDTREGTRKEALLTTIDHVGIATPSLDEARALYEGVFGMQALFEEELPDQGTRVLMLGSGTSRVELLAPLRDESPVGRFLAERGAGVHHVAYQVDDLRAALARCSTAGLQLVDQAPRVGAGGHLVAFLHPRGTGRVLIELVEAVRS